MFRMTPLRRAAAALMTLALLALPGAAHAAAVADAPGWNQALAPLAAMPVQEDGYIRSATTFGLDQIKAITGQRQTEGLDALPAALWLMAHPAEAHSAALLKITHPDLLRLYGSKRISLSQWADPTAMQRLSDLYHADPQAWERPLGELQERAEALDQLEANFAIVPRAGEWLTPAQARARQDLTDADRAILAQWDALKEALAADRPETAGAPAAALAAAVLADAQARSVALPDLPLDVFYHQYRPFYWSAVFYLLAALGFGGALIVPRIGRLAGRLGYAMLIAGFALEAVGVTVRWILVGHAPLANMFESFTFAIGGLVLVALIFEAIWKTKLAGLGGAVLGFIFMVLAHAAPIFEPKIRPIMPALQSSWLTYHVITIMLSYSFFALSFFAALCYLAKDLFGGRLASRLPALDALDVFNYRIIAVGFPLLTLGIIFGAVWADTAWGRPWGFDPKETWSAITWLIYAIYLHARYLAGWQGRRAAILAIIGFGAVLFTYLGVNFLLAGLHSYA